MDNDDDLPPASLDLSGYFLILAARLGRRPTLGEVAAFRHEVAGERVRRMRRRRARKPAKGGVPAQVGNRGRKEPEPVKEFFTSLEWLMAVSLMMSLVICITELASLRLSGRRITMPKARLAAAAKAVAITNEERDDPHGLGPRPLGSFTPDTVMLGFRATKEARASRLAGLYADPLFPRAVAALLRANGKPICKVEGRDAWEIVESVDRRACDHLRSLGTDPDLWKPLRLEVRAAQKKALEAARRIANPWLGDPEPPPGYLDRVMQLGTPTGAAAYTLDDMMQLATPAGAAAHCSRQSWRAKGTTAAAAAAVADIELEPEPTDEPTKKPVHG